jgi:hypothetical protein
MDSGELREQELQQGSQQRFAPSSRIVHKLKALNLSQFVAA